MAETTLEFLQRHLALEEESDRLQTLPEDFYTRIASYTRDLKRSSSSALSEVTNRLISSQLDLIDGMVRQVLSVRMRKALSASAVRLLLPEERYVGVLEVDYARRLDSFAEAVSSGQLSLVELAQSKENARSAIVRFTKEVPEIIGLDMRRYGPFKPNDLASIPAANAELLVANEEAVLVHTRDGL